MKLKMPDQDNPSKASAVIQLVCFVLLFLLIYLPVRRLSASLLIRIAMLIGVYFVVSIIVFVVLRPLMLKLEAKHRKRK